MPYTERAPTYHPDFFNPDAIANEWNRLSYGHLSAELHEYVTFLRDDAICMLLMPYDHPSIPLIKSFHIRFNALRVIQRSGQITPKRFPCMQRVGLLGLRTMAILQEPPRQALFYEVLQCRPEFQWFLAESEKV